MQMSHRYRLYTPMLTWWAHPKRMDIQAHQIFQRVGHAFQSYSCQSRWRLHVRCAYKFLSLGSRPPEKGESERREEAKKDSKSIYLWAIGLIEIEGAVRDKISQSGSGANNNVIVSCWIRTQTCYLIIRERERDQRVGIGEIKARENGKGNAVSVGTTGRLDHRGLWGGRTSVWAESGRGSAISCFPIAGLLHCPGHQHVRLPILCGARE